MHARDRARLLALLLMTSLVAGHAARPPRAVAGETAGGDRGRAIQSVARLVERLRGAREAGERDALQREIAAAKARARRERRAGFAASQAANRQPVWSAASSPGPWPVPRAGAAGALLPPCPPDTALEPNDLCTNARPLALGATFSPLVVLDNDPDFYLVTLRRSEQLMATVTFTNADGNIDVRLYERNPATGCVGALVAISATNANVETINYVNGGAEQPYFLYVTLASGTCNTYALTLASFGTSNLTAVATPPGWSSPIVPRNAASATDVSAPLTPTLAGNAPATWINCAAQRQGTNPVGPWVGDVTLDDAPVALYATSFPDSLPAAFPIDLNRGPFTIPGGRHTLRSRTDVLGNVPETNELDNAWSGQWVWSPLALATATPISRPRPPLSGPLSDPNCDGFAYTRAPGLAWVTSLAPRNAGDDYDLYVFSDYSGSSSGFSDDLAAPFFGDNYTEFVVGSASAPQSTVYPAAVLFEAAGGGGACILDQTTSAGRVFPNPTDAGAVSQTLPPDRLADVYEVFVDVNQAIEVSVRRRSGPGRLAFQVFPSTPGAVFAAGVAGIPSVQLTPTIETLAYGPVAPAGYHPIVVFRERGTQASQPIVYDLRINTTQLVEAPPPAAGFALGMRAEPNPFAGAGCITYVLPVTGPARLRVFDVNGRLVRTLEQGVLQAGRHEARWDGRDDAGVHLAPGLYLARLEAGGRALTRRITLLD